MPKIKLNISDRDILEKLADNFLKASGYVEKDFSVYEKQLDKADWEKLDNELAIQKYEKQEGQY